MGSFFSIQNLFSFSLFGTLEWKQSLVYINFIWVVNLIPLFFCIQSEED